MNKLAFLLGIKCAMDFTEEAEQEAKTHKALLVSGVPHYEKSDIDLLDYNPEFKEEIKEQWTSPSGRFVNLIRSGNERRLNALEHRNLELELAAKFPEKVDEVIELKQQGVKTEAAWCQVFGIETEDPYTDIFQLRELL